MKGQRSPTSRAATRQPRVRRAAALALALAVVGCQSGAAPSASLRPSAGSFGTASAVASSLPPSDASASVAPSLEPSPSIEPSASSIPSIVPVPTSSFGAAPTTSARLTDATAAALQRALEATRTKTKLPGIAAAVVFPDGRTWTGAAGLADRTTGRAMTTGTLFSVGSITKTFVAALVLRLADRGVVGLDDPLSRYVPAFPNASKITLRMLLSHTSGIQDLFMAPGMADAILAAPSRAWTPAEVLARIGKPYFAPGAGYHYSNTNYVLLGQVVERATGQRLADLIRAEFLSPLGLHATFLQNQEPASGPLAHGYMGSPTAPRDVSGGQRMIPFVSEVTAAGASGALASTVGDLAVWASALYGGGILDEADLASMVDVSPTLPFKPRFPYGLGLEECLLAGRPAWGHRGYLDGFWSSMAYLPAEHLTVVVFMNAQWAGPPNADPLAPSSALVAAAIAPPATPAATAAASPKPSPAASPTASGTPTP